MPQNERVLITFEGKDTGLASTAKNAAEAVRRFAADLERMKQRGGELDLWKKSLQTTQKQLNKLKAVRDSLEQIKASSQKWTKDQERRLRAVNSEVGRQSTILSNVRKIIQLRNEENMIWNNRIQLAKQVQSIEARIAQNKSIEITRGRIQEQVTRRRQDEMVQASVSEAFKPKGFSQMLGKWMGGDAQGGAQAAVIGGLTGALTKMTAAFAILGAAVKTITTAFKIFVAMINASIAVVKLAAQGLGKYVQGLVGILRIQGNVVKSVGRFVKSLWDKWKAMRKAGDETSRTDGLTRSYGANLRGLVGTVNNLNKSINVFGASIRQIGQAVQNAGVLLTIYLSIPVGNAMKAWTNVALAFDEALVEVRKNADLTRAGFSQLRQELMDLAAMSPTALVDLTGIAADAARIGVASKDIMSFVAVMDMLVVATTVGADEGAVQMGRLLSIFYSTGEGAKQLERDFSGVVNGIGSALNELGKANKVNESEILAATMRMAPAARAIGLTVQESMALAATVAGGSASAERAGTQLNALLVKVAVNVSKIAAAGGVAMNDLAAAIVADPIESFVLLAEAIESIEDPLLKIQANAELFGLVGGKAMGIVESQTSTLRDNIEISNMAFRDGTSLIIEYARAQDAVSNQVKILKNNLSILGITIGEAVLPVITKLLTVIIPLIQAFTVMFKESSDEFKQMIVVSAGLVVALGPLSYALGSLLFQIGIFTTGMTGLISMMARATAGPLNLALSLLGMLTPFKLVIAGIFAVIGAIILFGNTLGTVGVGIASFAAKLMDFGFRAMNAFAQGIFTIVNRIYDFIANFLLRIVGILQPKRDVKEAGEKVADDFVEGVTDVDLKPVEEVGKSVGKALEKGVTGVVEENKIGPVVQAWGYSLAEKFTGAFVDLDLTPVTEFADNFGGAIRDALSPLSSEAMGDFADIFGQASSIFSAFAGIFDIDSAVISVEISKIGETLAGVFNNIDDGSATVAGAFEGIRKYIGAFADDLELLLGLTVKYREEEEALLRIKEKLEGFDKETSKQALAIARRTDLSAFERAALIRKLKGDRIEEKEALKESEKMQKKKVKTAKEEVSAQKQLVNILKQFIPSVSQPKKKKADEIGGIDLSNFDNKLLDQANSDIDDSLGKMEEMYDTFGTKITKARQYIIGLISGLLGKQLLIYDDINDVEPEFWQGLAQGDTARAKYLGWWDYLAVKIEAVQDALTAVAGLFDAFIAGVKTGFDPTNPTETTKESSGGRLTKAEAGVKGAGMLIGIIAEFFDSLFVDMQDIFMGGDETLLGKAQRILGESWKEFIKNIDPDGSVISSLGDLADAFTSIGTALAEIAGLSFDNIPTLAGGIATIVDKVLAGGTMIIKTLGLIAELARLGIGTGSIAEVVASADAMGMGEDLSSLFDNEGLTGGLAGFDAAGLGGFLAGIINDALQSLLDNIDTSLISTGLAQIINTALGFIGGLDAGVVGETLSTLPNMIIDALSGIDPLAVQEAATNLINSFLEYAENINFSQAVDSLFGIINGLVEGIGNVEWSRLTGPLTDIGRGILEGLAEVDFMTFMEPITAIANALIETLGDDTLWANAKFGWDNLIDAVEETMDGIEWQRLEEVFGAFEDAIIFGLNSINYQKIFGEIIPTIAKAFFDALKFEFMKLIGLGMFVTEDEETGGQKLGLNLAGGTATAGPGPVNPMMMGALAMPGVGPIIGAMATAEGLYNALTGFFSSNEAPAPEIKPTIDEDELSSTLESGYDRSSKKAQPALDKVAQVAGTQSGFMLGKGTEAELTKNNGYFYGVEAGFQNWFGGGGDGTMQLVGHDTGGAMGQGIYDDTKTGYYMEGIPTGAISWINSNVGNLIGIGTVIGELFNFGIKDALSQTTMFDALIGKFEEWLDNYGQIFLQSFYILGLEAYDQYTMGFSGGGLMPSTRDINSTLQGLHAGFAKQKEITALSYNEPVAPPPIPFVGAAGVQTAAATPNRVDITVNGYMSNSDTDQLASNIWNRWQREIKNKA